MSGLYGEEYDFFHSQDELEVIFSLMSDKELMSIRDRVQELSRQRVYEKKEFPLSAGGLNWIIATIMFAFWVRKGKGIKVVRGEIEVCELKESPFWERYQAPDISRDEIIEEETKLEPEVVRGEKEAEWV